MTSPKIVLSILLLASTFIMAGYLFSMHDEKVCTPGSNIYANMTTDQDKNGIYTCNKDGTAWDYKTNVILDNVPGIGDMTMEISINHDK